MALILSPVEQRIVGSLIEKERFTPDTYPLTLNALRNACNQKSNRDPMMELDDATITAALGRLRDQGLVMRVHRAGESAQKYQHNLEQRFGFGHGQVAVVGVLLLRGAQTLNELKIRTERLHDFKSVDEIKAVLEGLMIRSPAIVTKLDVRPGQKEARYTHLLGGEPVVNAAPTPRPRAVEVVEESEESEPSFVSAVDAEKQVTENEARLLRAMTSADHTALDELLHDDLLFNGPTGETATKALDLQNYRSGQVKLRVAEASQLDLSVIRDDVVVAVSVRLEGEYLGQAIAGTFRYLRVWKYDGARWQVIAGSAVATNAR